MHKYPTNLTDKQWQVIKNMLETVRNTVMRLLHCDLDVVLRSDKRTDRFVPMPKRWIVERTFSWLENFRRLTIDYEYRADTHEAMMHIAAIKLFLNKI